MALFHLHLKNISRADGTADRPRSALACAAYRAGQTLWNEAEEKESRFGGRRDVVHAEILLPVGAPAWMSDRASLWNAVETTERRKDSRLAKEAEFALPRELPRGDWLAVVRKMANAYVLQGYAVDLAIHDDGHQHNPHAHMMMTTRAITPAGFGGKLREADGKTFLKDMRTTWQTIANEALAAAGVSATIDARSHAARGIEQEPGRHQGPDPAARRERRERMDPMPLPMDRAMQAAMRDLVAEDGVRERYPIMAARPDWPPASRGVSNLISSPESREQDRFWAEVEQRAHGEQLRDEPGQPGVAREDLGPDVEATLERVRNAPQAADERAGILDAARKSYADIQERLTAQAVRAGWISPRTAEELRELDRTLYRDEFSRLFAEARRLEAKRNEVGRMPQATPEQRRELAAEERRAETRSFDDYDREREQEPDPDGNAITRKELDRAQDAMLREVESTVRSQIGAPHPDRLSADHDAEREAARDAVERMADLPVSDREADSYRPAPHERASDWLAGRLRDGGLTQSRDERPAVEEQAREPQIPTRVSASEWLRQRLVPGRSLSQEPERDEREDRDRERDRQR